MKGSTLYRRQHWPDVQVLAQYRDCLPEESLVQSVHVVAFDDWGRVIIVRDEAGRLSLPGGTREPGETINNCIAREAQEEAGLSLTDSLVWFGAHFADGYKTYGYKPHLPHPGKAWLWGVCDARITGPPTNPPAAGRTAEVMRLQRNDARWLMSSVETWFGPLLDRAYSTRAHGKRSGGSGSYGEEPLR